MPMNKLKSLCFVFVCGLLTVGYAQEKEEVEEKDLGTQEVTVIKSYSPSLSDVFKIKESPQISDSLTGSKKAVDYSIFSVPVISTFVPSKGSARKLQPKAPKLQYNSRAFLGFGGYNRLLAEYGTYWEIDRRQQVSWLLQLNPTFKDVPGSLLDSRQAHYLLDVSHRYATNKRNSFSQINFRQHQQSFYGLRSPFSDPVIDQNIAPEQQLNYLSVNTQWQWYDLVIKEVQLKTYFTSDSFSTSELEVQLNSKFQLDVGAITLGFNPEFNYLSTSFDQAFYTQQPYDYSAGLGKLRLFASKTRGKFKFKFGALGVYAFGDEFEENNLFVYPDVNLSYQPNKGNFAPFLRVRGQLRQNGFRKFTHLNPYTAPGTALQTSDVPLEIRLGTRSKFAAGWEFTWNAVYESNRQTPLFRSVGFDTQNQDFIPYRYGNAFEVFYNELTSLGVEAKLSAAFKNGGQLSLSATYLDFEAPEDNFLVTNLPQLTLDFSGTIKLTPKIYTQWNVVHRGDRTNTYRDVFLGQDLNNAPFLEEQLAAYTQLDAKIIYQLNDRWEFEISGTNLLDEPLYQWANYQVYGQTLLMGVRYNFDLNF